MTVKPNAPFSRDELVEYMESKNIETRRPIMSGNMDEQPVREVMNHRVSGDLKNSRIIMKNSFFIGIHQNLTTEEKEYMANTITEFIESKIK
jgi:CDP-6-deoxy-D-xylo-4-hexulose-3-dehydrase